MDDARPSKRNTTGPPREGCDADVMMGLDGYLEIQVSNSYAAQLADGWGLLPEIVQREILRDNQERILAFSQVPETQFPNGEERAEGSEPRLCENADGSYGSAI